MWSTLFIAVLAFCGESIAGPIEPRAYAKRGLTWTWFNKSPLDPGKFNGAATYIYNYETYRPSTGTANLNFIGMQGCYPSCDSSPVEQLANRKNEQGWNVVFSANEPDLQGHSPAQVASWYRQWIEPLTIQKSYPSVSSSTNSGQGLDWLQQFINNCNGCYHDFINLHWYGHSFNEFTNYISNAHNRFPGEKIVVTEYALIGASASAQNSFFSQAAPWLDGQSYVSMHFPFVATSPALLSQYDSGAVGYVGTGSCLYNNDGSLSAVGNTFRG